MLLFCHHSNFWLHAPGPGWSKAKSFLLRQVQSLNHKTDSWGWKGVWKGDEGLKKKTLGLNMIFQLHNKLYFWYFFQDLMYLLTS